jgi:HEAT repeat protein
MKKRLLLGTSLVLAAGLAAAVALPVTRYPILGFLRNERLLNGRPVGYWVSVLKDDEDADVRRQAALNLGEADVCNAAPKDNLQCPAVMAALAQALADQDDFVRKCAATSFLLCPKEAGVPQECVHVVRLAGALRDKEAAVRKAAVRALWQVDPAPMDEEVAGRLAEGLVDTDDFVRMYAARALARMGAHAKPAIPALVERLRLDEEHDVRKLAGKALGLIGAEAIGPLLPETIKGLTLGLKDKAPGFREYAARALGQLGAAEALPACGRP